MKTEIIRITKNEMRSIDDRSGVIENLNRKIQIIRKRQLLTTLKEATSARLDLLHKMKNWIDMLDKRIFDQNNIDNMSLDKVIALFKYVGNFSLKMMSQMNDVEGIMREYLETQNISSKFEQAKITGTDEEQKQLKKELMKSFMDSMKQTAAEAIVSTQKQEVQQQIDLKNEIEASELDSMAKGESVEVDVTGLEELPDDLLK